MSKRVSEQLYVLVARKVKKPVEAKKLGDLQDALNKGLKQKKIKEEDIDIIFNVYKKIMKIK